MTGQMPYVLHHNLAHGKKSANRRLQITLSGFSFVVINFLTLLWYNPTLDQDMPRWVYASWAIGLFLYQTFDAVDGTQACVGRTEGWKVMLYADHDSAGGERTRVDHWGSFSTMVHLNNIMTQSQLADGFDRG